MLDRRFFLGSALSALALAAGGRSVLAQTPPLRGTIDGALRYDRVETRRSDAQTEQLQAAIDRAARAGRPLFLPAGLYRVGTITLPDGTHIVGQPGRTRLVRSGAGPLLRAEGAAHLSLTNLVIDGEAGQAARADALVELRDCPDARLEGLEITRAPGSGLVMTRCGGHVARCTIGLVADAGIHARDSTGLTIEGNTLRDIGNNGIQVWRTVPGEDGTIVRGNRIERVRWDGGGNGQNGNGINVFRAGQVLVSGNRVSDCAFSAVRVNAGDGAQIVGNSASRLGEVALFVEFGARGAAISGNTIDGAAAGISVTNFDEDGRLATIQGNVVRGITATSAVNPDTRPYGIAAEADCAVTGNVVEDSAGLGLLLGWGPYLRNVAASGNMIRRAAIGIGVSVAPGAGAALVSDNLVAESSRAAVVGMEWTRIATADLVQSDTTHRNLTVARNRTA